MREKNALENAKQTLIEANCIFDTQTKYLLSILIRLIYTNVNETVKLGY